MHFPAVHVPLTPQTTPQPLQFSESVWKSAHVPCLSHAWVPAGHWPQLPEVHSCFVRQALPQALQFFGSEEASTQPVGQAIWPGVQMTPEPELVPEAALLVSAPLDDEVKSGSPPDPHPKASSGSAA